MNMNKLTYTDTGDIEVSGVFTDEKGDLHPECLFYFLGENDIIEINEVNDRVTSDSLLIDSNTGHILILTQETFWWSLKNQQSAILTKVEDCLTTIIDTTKEEHCNFLCWYYAMRYPVHAVMEMYKDCGWEITDPSWVSFQVRKEIIPKQKYIFREHRIVNPETKELTVYESEMDYDNYVYKDLVEACAPYGYTEEQVSMWIDTGEEIPLMLECIFEQEH